MIAETDVIIKDITAVLKLRKVEEHLLCLRPLEVVVPNSIGESVFLEHCGELRAIVAQQIDAHKSSILRSLKKIEDGLSDL